MKYRQITLIIVLILVITGVIALFTMPRSEDPHITVRQGLVIATYPGADELQMEKQVTNKIEQYLFGFEEVRKAKTKSETKEGLTVITAELNENVKDPKKFWSTLQHGLNMNMPGILPSGVQGPIVNSDFGDVVAQMITVSAPGRSYADIEKYLDKLEDGIKTIPEVSKIKRYGGQKQQIYIIVEDEKLRQYGFDFSTIANVLQTQNVTKSTGDITLSASNIPIFANSRYQDETAIGNQIVYSNPQGKVVRLKDVARIERRYEQLSSMIKVGDNNVMMLTVEMQPGNNIVGLGKELDKKIEEVKHGLPSDVKVDIIVNQPEVVKESVSHFMVEFAIAIASVIIVVMLLLPLRIATISAIAAPVSIAVTFGILNMIGIEIHQVTLAAMIIVLGMVVDDAIVIVDNYIEKLDEGIPSWTAAWQAATQLIVPVFTATVAIIFAFLPLAFCLNGLAKEFIQALPVAVGVALFTSFLVAILLTPYLCFFFLKKGLKHQVSERPPKKKMLDYLQDGYNKAVEFCFRWPKATLLTGVLSIVLAMFLGTKAQQELFPTSERNQFNIEVWMQNGTDIGETAKAMKKVEDAIKGDKRVVGTASFIGTSSPRFQSSYAPETPRENFGQIFINTTSAEATEEMAREYLGKFNNFLPNGYVRVRQLSLKETPAPVEVRVIGDDLNDQKRVAAQVAGILEKTPGANWIRTDYQDDYFGIKANTKEDVASRLGVTNSIITQTLGGEIKGYPVSTLWEGDKPVDILLRLDIKNRADFNELQNIYVSTQYNTKVPLKEVVTLAPSWHTGVIAHRNGLRTLTVRSEAQLGVKATAILAAAKPEIVQLKLPDGIRIGYGGEEESAGETQPAMGKSLMISLILIFLTLLFQFKNIGKVLIVLSTFPLSLLGAMLGLIITGNPMGFTAFMGIISLMGIVVRNGIILVDYADELILEHGYTVKAAALASAKRRMRPIFLTSSAAAIGVVPMILGKSPLWAPLGSVLAVGLIVSMVMTLFVVPVLYYKFIKTAIHPESAPQPDADDHIQYKPSHLILPALLMVTALFAQTASAQTVSTQSTSTQTASAQSAPPRNTLTLEQCKQLAIERNNNLKIARENIKVAQSQKIQADAGGKPTVDGSVTGFYFGKPLNSILPEYGVSPGIQVNQSIYSGGKVKLEKASAEKEVEIQEEQKILTTSDVLLNTVKAYWQVVSASERIRLAEQSDLQLKAIYIDLNNQYTAGITYKNDVLRAKVQQNQNDLNLVKARNALTLAKLNLAQVTGLGDSVHFVIADSISDSFTPLQTDTALQQAITSRSEIRILFKNIESGKIQKKILNADTKPSVSLGLNGIGAAGKQGINPGSNSNFLATYYGTVSVNIPIFDWGKRKQKVQQQQYRIAAQEYQLKERQELISLEVQQAWLELNQSAKRIELSGASLEQAEENLRLSNDRLKAGTIIGKDVLEAQTLWQQAYSDIIDAKVEYKVNEANYKKALGELK